MDPKDPKKGGCLVQPPDHIEFLLNAFPSSGLPPARHQACGRRSRDQNIGSSF
jgi:hypothetical protein